MNKVNISSEDEFLADENPIIVCLPANHRTIEASEKAGAHQGRGDCYSCNQKVAYDDYTAELMKKTEKPVRLQCLECFLKDMERKEIKISVLPRTFMSAVENLALEEKEEED